MNLQQKVMIKLKDAMKSKDKVALESLRAIKSELLLAQTKGGNTDFTTDEEIKLIQKLVKQRKESAALYQAQNRDDLAQPELDQLAVIEQFLPKQISEEELTNIIKIIINKTNATSMEDMGKVMGIATKQLAGKADGKAISTVVRNLLN